MTTRIERRERVPPECAGLRLDQALARMFPEHSRARLQGWIRAGAVQVDGGALRSPRPRGRRRADSCSRPRSPTRSPPAPRPSRSAWSIAMTTSSSSTSRPAWWSIPGAGRSRGTLQNAAAPPRPRAGQGRARRHRASHRQGHHRPAGGGAHAGGAHPSGRDAGGARARPRVRGDRLGRDDLGRQGRRADRPQPGRAQAHGGARRWPPRRPPTTA